MASLFRRLASFTFKIAMVPIKIAKSLIARNVPSTWVAPLRKVSLSVAATAMKWLSAFLSLPALGLPSPVLKDSTSSGSGYDSQGAYLKIPPPGAANPLPRARARAPAAAAAAAATARRVVAGRFGPSLPEGSREGEVFLRERERMRLGFTPVSN